MKLEMKQISKSFGEKQVLKAVDLTAHSGKALGILGRNGAGKTTTIRILMNVFAADEGRVLLDGAPWTTAASGSAICRRNGGCTPKRRSSISLSIWRN